MSLQYLSAAEAEAINNLMPGNQITRLGSRLKYALDAVAAFGQKWYLDPVNGSDDNDGQSSDTAFKTLPAAYEALTENKNEVLFILGGAAANNLKEPFAWAKDFTHCIGVGQNNRFGGRVRIGHAGYPMSPMFTVSGSGCIFQNLHFQHGESNAANLIAVLISGLRNQFIGCHFEASLDSIAGGGTYAWRAVQIAVAAQANGFLRCTFGSWTRAWASVNGKLLYFMGDNADTIFDDCFFVRNTTQAGMKLVDFAGALSGGQSYVAFNDCLFASTNAKVDVVFGKPTNGWVLVNRCKAANVTAWGTTNVNLIIANGAADEVLGGIGIAQS